MRTVISARVSRGPEVLDTWGGIWRLHPEVGILRRRMSGEVETAPNYEEMFAHRFTAADDEYQAMVKCPADPPPIVDDWRVRAGGNHRMSGEVETAPNYEEMFAHRFTAADDEYQAMVKCPADPPPIVDDWRVRAGGNHRMSGEVETAPNYEEMFAHRFTAADDEYQAMVKCPADPPPIVDDWRVRAGGNHRSQDYRPYKGRDDSRNWSYNRQWHGRGRGYNQSPVHHQGPYESYSQGSNSHWQSNHHRY
ncbi:uncharacterized protein LOC121270004 isoform X3 [Carcharodon carcharias]|uniref:uncharacterized protein LOC121270004 isoform X3 n=1 Tax=Carcharodon carcharias TaxID=13397 RepID=UPI001B7E3C98|nr:uncharacterized protein LOC121270004 isoform X3 [Carcharodon carcharias]